VSDDRRLDRALRRVERWQRALIGAYCLQTTVIIGAVLALLRMVH